MSLAEFQENARRFGRFSRAGIAAGRRNQKKVGQTGLRGNHYDADFFTEKPHWGGVVQAICHSKGFVIAPTAKTNR